VKLTNLKENQELTIPNFPFDISRGRWLFTIIIINLIYFITNQTCIISIHSNLHHSHKIVIEENLYIDHSGKDHNHHHYHRHHYHHHSLLHVYVDFRMVDDDDYFGLAPGNVKTLKKTWWFWIILFCFIWICIIIIGKIVGLKYAFRIICDEVEFNAEGEQIALKCFVLPDSDKVKL
jgi:hypothetical protein